MKTEQEIVLQKKMIIIFSLLLLIGIMGILNLQKKTVLAANNDGQIVRVYTNYVANEAFFTVPSDEKVEIPLGLTLSGELLEEEIVEEELVVIEESGEEAVVSHETQEVKTPVASRGSYVRATNLPPTEYEKVIQVKATAYCLCQKCCGKSPSHPGYGYTASGLRIVPGTGMKVIAVDTSVVPLGTEVYVEGLNGASNYGYAIAADTGSAIKNKKIDLYMDTHEQALAWGVRDVNLYILKSE